MQVVMLDGASDMNSRNIVAKLDPERIRMFWTFICERQNIYWRRKAGKQRPWTDDPILDKHFFCNIYRELDRGTQYVFDKIFNVKMTQHTMVDIVFKVMVYRLFNQPSTYEFLKSQLGRFNAIKAGKILDAKRLAHIKLFRGAWMAAASHSDDGESKAAVYCKSLETVFRDRAKLIHDLSHSESIEEAWYIIQRYKWFGPFVAYQVVLDFSYLKFFAHKWGDLETWVYPGPGAKKGIYWLMGYNPIVSKGSKEFREGMSDNDIADIIRYLCTNQEAYFRRFKLKFKLWEGKLLDVNNIEFSLCEFQKYMRAQHGGKKRKFIPLEDK